MSHIFDKNSAITKGEKSRDPPSFDPSQVKIDAQLSNSVDKATRALLHITSLAQESLDQNKRFLIEFERRYESNEDSSFASKKNSGNERKKKLDGEILDTIEEGVRKLKEKILYEYVEQTSTITILVLVAIFAGLGFTTFKVNRMLNKAHVF